MKNKEANRHVLKAISIGLSAAISLMPTVTAFADDDVDQDGGETGQSQESSDSSQESSESENHDVSESCDEAFDACDDAVDLAEASYPEASAETGGVDEAVPVLSDGAVIETPASGEIIGSEDQIAIIIENLTEAAAIVGTPDQGADSTGIATGSGFIVDSGNTDGSGGTEQSGIKENDNSLENEVAKLDKINKEAEDFNENHKTEDEEKILEDAISGAEEMVGKAAAGTATDAEVEEALKKADEAVKTAKGNKAEAERLVSEATDELELILADCDIEYEVDEDGDITVTDTEKLDTRTRTALEKAQAAVDAAKQNLQDADDALEDASLNKWLTMVKGQMDVVNDCTEKGNKKTEGTKVYEGYKLAAYLQAYQVTTWEGVDPDSVDVVYNNAGYGNDANRNLWYVKYKNAGDECYHRVYLDIHFDKVNDLNSLIASEHLIKDEAPFAFGDECNDVNNLKFGVNTADGSLIDGAITGDVDPQQADYRAVKAEIDRLISENLKNGKIQDVKDVNVKAKLTVQMAKLYLAGQGYDIDRLDTPDWYNIDRGDVTALAKGTSNTKDQQRYIPVRYTDEDGNTKDFYFMYNIKGNDAVEIFQRTPTEMAAAWNDYGNKADYTQYLLDDADHGNGTDPDHERRYDINSILGRETELQNNKTKANGLLEAVKNARDKVVAAQQALLTVQKIDAKYGVDIEKYEKRLEAAQKEYDELKEKLDEVTDDDPEESGTPDERGSSSDGTSETSPGPGPGAPGGTPVDITAPAASTPVETIAGPGVIGETSGTAFTDLRAGTGNIVAGSGAFTDVSDIESGVLMEDELLDDGVLGERMAPMVEAVNNGTFTRNMLFSEDGLKINFMWWLIILALGAKGVQMYVKSRLKASKQKDRPDK